MALSFLQIFLTLTGIAVACFLVYKISLSMGLKIIDLCFNSKLFRQIIIICLALFFGAVGLLQLRDFLELTDPGLSRFFILSFLVAGGFVFLAFKRQS